MGNVVVYEKDGLVTSLTPIPPFTAEDVLAKDVPAGATQAQLMEGSLVYSVDPYFKRARKIEDGKIVVDMVKAREVHLKVIREVRDAKLVQLDIEWMKFTGQGKKQEADAAEAKRQALRDLPQTVNLDVATPELLKEIWPVELPEDKKPKKLK